MSDRYTFKPDVVAFRRVLDVMGDDGRLYRFPAPTGTANEQLSYLRQRLDESVTIGLIPRKVADQALQEWTDQGLF